MTEDSTPECMDVHDAMRSGCRLCIFDCPTGEGLQTLMCVFSMLRGCRFAAGKDYKLTVEVVHIKEAPAMNAGQAGGHRIWCSERREGHEGRDQGKRTNQLQYQCHYSS